MSTSTAARLCALCLMVALIQPPSASAAEFAWRPLGATGDHVIIGHEIQLASGGQRVFLELELSGWGPAELATWQATLDSAAFGQSCSGGTNAGSACFNDTHCFEGVCLPTRPGPLIGAVEACALDDDCVAAFGDAGATCDQFSGLCRPGWQNTSRSDFVIQGGLAAVDTSTPNFRYGSQSISATAPDDGSIFYGGSLALDVPINAAGSYVVAFRPVGFETFMSDANSQSLTDITLTSAVITVFCETNANCDDFDACTDDICQADNTCRRDINFDDTTSCCDPVTGNLTPLDDGNECTQNVCNPDGTVDHPPQPEFTSCGSSGDTECDNPDSCDGAGNCLERLEPDGTACGNSSATECDDPDTCDGTGVCRPNFKPPTTPCGDPGDTQCDDPDSCNATGTCRSNHVADGTACDDTLFCNVNESCASGACSGGSARDCSDGLSCTTDTCDETNDVCVSTLDAGNCLIDATCFDDGAINPADDCEECNPTVSTGMWTDRADGSECNDQDPCTGTGRTGIGVDTCSAGACSGTLDPECNDGCLMAQTAVLGTNVASNHDGGPDDAEASCQPDSNNDVWFVYTADCNAPIYLDTVGSLLLPVNDPVLSVYDECPDNGGVEIACDDNSGLDLHAELSFVAELGEDYYIRMAGTGSNNGTFELTVTLLDDCRIGDGCYAIGDRNPQNDCMACLVDSATQWSDLPGGTSCGNMSEDDCDAPDTCDGNGFCQSNPKPDGTLCLDDGNACTEDVCAGGTCTHPPEPAGLACGDPRDTECDNPNTCDGAGACAANFEPAGLPCGDATVTQCDLADSCDGGGSCLTNHVPDGTECDDGLVYTGFDACASGACVGVPLPEAPLVEPLGSLAITVAPQPVGLEAPVALHLTSPDWTCLDLYVDVDGSLVDQPVIQTVAAWGTIVVPGPEIAPDSTYHVRAEVDEFASDPGVGTTEMFANLNGDDRVNFIDIALMVEYFLGQHSEVPLAVKDIAPCTLDGVVDFRDIEAVIQVFLGIPYWCPPPCP